MSAIRPADLDAQAIFDRYHAAWTAMDPDAIADLHAADSSFWIQDGSPRIEGREALRAHYAQLFARYPRLAWDIRRVLFGPRRWVFDYDLLIGMTSALGAPIEARVSMTDVIDFDDTGAVTRKDVFMDADQVRAAGIPT